MKKDLDTYEKWTKLSQNAEAQELAKYIGLQKESIPFFANLLRTYMYLKTIDEMKSKYNSNKVISYVPLFLRAPLVDQICYDYRKFSETVIINELEKIEFKEKFERKRIAKEYCANVELDLPMLTTAILKGCGNGKRNEFIDEILNFRNDKNVKKIRNKFIKFRPCRNPLTNSS
ncbi:hypothetical protein [Methanolacinia petrolearia]|uniref:hypothetical protein n=1 Tax=Methanolacinia petrolearia TaxID=54120 RepID=UPI003BA8B214